MAAMSFSEREIAGATCSTVKLISRWFAAVFPSGMAHLGAIKGRFAGFTQLCRLCMDAL
jgi:hypothetical protein